MDDIIINIYTGSSDNTHSLTQKIDLLMASFQELSAKVGELTTQVTNLQAAIDAEQQEITDALNALNATIQQLQQQIADGGTVEQRQELLDRLISIQTNLTAAQTDLSSTVGGTPGTANGGTDL